jgi:protein-disulfide isomerase
MKKVIKLVAITVTGLAIALTVTETWSKGARLTNQDLDQHRVGVVEETYTITSQHMMGRATQNTAHTWARVALGDPGYGFVGHVSAVVPTAMTVKSGDRVEVALSANETNVTPDRIVRVVGH